MNENDNNLTISLLKELDNVSRFFKTENNYPNEKVVERIYTAEYLEKINKLKKNNLSLNIDRVLEIKNRRNSELEYQAKIINNKEKFNKRTKSLNIISKNGEKLIKDIYYLI